MQVEMIEERTGMCVNGSLVRVKDHKRPNHQDHHHLALRRLQVPFHNQVLTPHRVTTHHRPPLTRPA